jgi:hypothetical protein
LIMSLYLSPFFIFYLFSQSSVVNLRWGTYIPSQDICIYGYRHVKCMSMFLYDELALKRVTHGRNACMMNKNFDSCPNSTTKIS